MDFQALLMAFAWQQRGLTSCTNAAAKQQPSDKWTSLRGHAAARRRHRGLRFRDDPKPSGIFKSMTLIPKSRAAQASSSTAGRTRS